MKKIKITYPGPWDGDLMVTVSKETVYGVDSFKVEFVRAFTSEKKMTEEEALFEACREIVDCLNRRRPKQ